MIARRIDLWGPERLVVVGAALATALVLAGVAAQFANYALGLDASALDSKTDGGALGLLGDVALGAAALTALLTGRARPALLLAFLTIDKVLRLHDHVPGWPAYYLPLICVTFVLLVRAGRRLPGQGRRLMAVGLLLLGGSLLLHFTGETVLDTIGAGRQGWGDQFKVAIKHGAEVEGWLLIALALALGARRPEAGPTRARPRQAAALAEAAPAQPHPSA